MSEARRVGEEWPELQSCPVGKRGVGVYYLVQPAHQSFKNGRLTGTVCISACLFWNNQELQGNFETTSSKPLISWVRKLLERFEDRQRQLHYRKAGLCQDPCLMQSRTCPQMLYL